MDEVQIGDIIARSDGQRYAIIDDDFPMTDISSDIIQLPASSSLAKNLIRCHIGDSFNFSSKLRIVEIAHSDYAKNINQKKKTIAEENRVSLVIANIKNAFNSFDFGAAEKINSQERVSDYSKYKSAAIRNLKKYIYDFAYSENDISETTKIITDAIESGAISENEVFEIKRRAVLDRSEDDRLRILKEEQELSRRRKTEEEKRLKELREAEEKLAKERRKRNNYKRIVASRNIKELIHFTNILNVNSIMLHGLLPRRLVDREFPNAYVNDENRFDNYKNATCLSVSFPNYKMFYKYQNENKGMDWAVLSLNPELLADLDIRYFFFFKENAAKSDSSRCTFEQMFGGSMGCNPENPQAEILAFGIIDPKYIQKIYVKTLDDKVFIERNAVVDVNVDVNARYFKYRSGDY